MMKDLKVLVWKSDDLSDASSLTDDKISAGGLFDSRGNLMYKKMLVYS